MAKFPAPAPEYIGPSNNNGGLGNKPIDRIVMHETQSPCESGQARKTAKYFMETEKDASAHYCVDPTEIIQSDYDSIICYHAPPNRHSLAVEKCGFSTKNPFTARKKWKKGTPDSIALEKCAWLVARLCLAYNVPPRWVGVWRLRMGWRGVTDHDKVSSAFGESSHWDLGFWPRRAFMKRVREHVEHAREKGK